MYGKCYKGLVAHAKVLHMRMEGKKSDKDNGKWFFIHVSLKRCEKRPFCCLSCGVGNEEEGEFTEIDIISYFVSKS
jgi:hypothetical protein